MEENACFVLVLPGATARALGDKPLTFGRGEDAGVRIDEGRVSRLHAAVEPAGDGYRIRDLDSTNGTYLNGRPVKARQILASGDEIKIGDQSLFFLDVTEAGLTQAANQARTFLERREPGDRRRAESLLTLVEREAGQRSFDSVLRLASSVRMTTEDAMRSVVAGSPSPELTTMVGRTAVTADLPSGGKLTFLFTDIQDSTAMTDRLGDQAWMGLLEVHDSIARRVAASFGGFEVKAQGDGFMLVFRDAGQAVLAAIEMQKALAEHTLRHPNRPLVVRMGLHTGEAVREGDDFFGRNVIIAARVSASANGGEILMTDDLRRELDEAGDVELSEGREIMLKGLEGSFRVFAVNWEDD